MANADVAGSSRGKHRYEHDRHDPTGSASGRKDDLTTLAPTPHALPFGWIGRSAKLAARTGYDATSALADVGVLGPDGRLHDSTLLGPAHFLLLCASVINMLGDEMHGAADRPMALGTASLAAKAMMADARLGAAIETLSRFFVLTGGACSVRLSSTTSEARIDVVATAERGTTTSMIEELMTHFLLQQCSFFLGFPLPLSRFVTPAADHPAMGLRHPYLLCPIVPGPVTALTFPRHYLAHPCAAKIIDGPLWDAQSFWLSHHPATAAGNIDRARCPTSAQMFDQLLEQDMPFKACCARLAVGGNEVQRRLLLEGWNYRRLRRIALLERSRPHLRAGAPGEDLAIALGYSDQRSLRRALKLATGMSIRELRSAVPGPGAGASLVMERLRSQALLMA